MSQYTTRSMLSVIDAYDLENEINNKIKNDLIGLHPEDIQIFAKVSNYSYYPIDFYMTKDGEVRIENDDIIAGASIFIGSKRQFLYKQYTVPSDSNRFTFDEYFKTAWNPDKFMIYLNGYLLNPALCNFAIPKLDNTYLKKILYVSRTLKAGDILDVFYIECDDNLTDNVPIVRDIHLRSYKYTARMDNETIIQIPYPNSTYPRSQNSFFVFNDKGEYLDNRYDYDISEDGRFITLLDPHKLLENGKNWLVFTFPYIEPDFEVDDGKNTIRFDQLYSIWNPSAYTGDGIVRFEPLYEEFDLTKKSFILFGGTTWIDPERYDLIDNNTIRFKYPEDKMRCGWNRYVMNIFNETSKFNRKYGDVEYLVIPVKATEYNQKYFDIPVVNKKYLSFLLFVGSILYDRDDMYEVNNTTHKIEITHYNDYVNYGRTVYFVFLKPARTRIQKETVFRKMEFPAKSPNPTPIPPYLYDDMEFNASNLLLFFRGVYLEPTRYRIINNKIYLNTTIPTGGYADNEIPPGNFTGIYLAAYTNPDDDPYKDIIQDMKEDNDYTQFEERYADVVQLPDDGYNVTIPFPYTKFTDTQFFITLEDKKILIPERNWYRVNPNTLYILDDNLRPNSKLRFTFMHNANKRYINKVEYSIKTSAGVNEYQLDMSPYNTILNLNMRSVCFYKGYELEKNQARFDYNNGILYILDTENIVMENNQYIDIVIFFTGIRKNHAIQNLPQSGYIYLKRHDIDRNYNNNLMAVFLNGKLVPRKDITKMTNNIYKFNRDVGERYNLEVRNMSPRIDSIVPFYKRANTEEDVPKQIVSRDFSGTVLVPNLTPYNRKHITPLLNPIIFDPSILDHPEWWISLIHRSHTHTPESDKDVNYTLKFFRDDYISYAESVDVTIELRVSSSHDNLTKQSDSSFLLVKLPVTITQRDKDYCYSTMRVENLTKAVTGDIHHQKLAIDGILGRFNISGIRTKENEECVLYYELQANKFDAGADKVGIFEWVVSTERDGTGIIQWVQHMDIQPTNSESIPTEWDVDDEEDD